MHFVGHSCAAVAGFLPGRQWNQRGCAPTLASMKKLLVVIVVLALAAFAVKKLQDA
jgi:hypothetical protein